MNVWFQHQLIASKRFAAANGWRCGKHFCLELLIRNKANYGRRDLDKYGYHLNACDHPEYFRVAGKPIAIVAHNYELDVDGLRRLGSVGIQDSHPGLVVIQALDGPIRFD